jgi:succinoglycan biosynthesis protein ExoM
MGGPSLAGDGAPSAGAHTAPAAPTRVLVCIPTFRRPAMLADLLASLQEQRFDEARLAVEIVVVDNDAGQSAEPVVAEVRDRLGWPVHYRLEPERNIAMARNRAVHTALARGAQLLAFVDDDERVPEHWLATLVEGLERLGADAVCGPVAARLDPATPRWLREAGFFGLPAATTGAPVAYPNMSNLLARAELFAGQHEPFDPRFGLLGGSDARLFAGWRLRGVRTLAVREATVEETIPPSRARPGWLLRRAFRVGNTALLVEKSLPRGQRRVLYRLGRSSLRLALGAVVLAPTLLLGRAAVLRALWNLCFGAGSWAAAAGYRYQEYRHVHGG